MATKEYLRVLSIEKIRSYILTISLLIVGLGVVTWFYVSGDNNPAIKGLHSGNLQVINFETLVPDRDGYLMCAPNFCAEDAGDIHSKTYMVSRAELSQALFSYTDNNAAIHAFRRDLGAWQFDFTERISTEKFPHVITVQLVQLSPAESSLNIYSRSELGSSKTEIHKDRVERWLRYVESSLLR